MNAIVNCSRRNFLKSSALAGGGLILGVYIPGLRNSVRAADQPASTVALNAFVRIAPDETVTVVVNHSELGQGPYTSIPMVVAEELDADWTHRTRRTAKPCSASTSMCLECLSLSSRVRRCSEAR